MANLTQTVYRSLGGREVKTPSGETVFSVWQGTSYALTAGAQVIELRRFKTRERNAFTCEFIIHVQSNNLDAANPAAGNIRGAFTVRRTTGQAPVIAAFEQNAIGDFQGVEPQVSLSIENPSLGVYDVLLNANGKAGQSIQWRVIAETIIYGDNAPTEIV